MQYSGGEQDFWADDLLDFRALGETFGRFVQGVEQGRVIAIEAGFGRGKTFFRTRWARQLRTDGACVVEVDAWRSDHSDDPLVTFLGALIGAVPEGATKETKRKAGRIVRSVATAGARIAVNAVARGAADEIAGLFEGEDGEAEGAAAILTDMTDEAGAALSKAASALIVRQLAVERVREKELPGQLDALRQLLNGEDDGRVVVIVDELDRCRPDYAIALLELLKHVFDHPGYVFVLMVNAEHLEALAATRFGSHGAGERYLDKFIDVRLKLPEDTAAMRVAGEALARELPAWTPFREREAFGRDEAARIAGEMASRAGLSMRQVKRTLMTVEIAVRTHPGKPLDVPALIVLAFGRMLRGGGRERDKVQEAIVHHPGVLLPRMALDRQVVKTFKSKLEALKTGYQREAWQAFHDQYGMLEPENPGIVEDWKQLAGSYLPEHRAVLEAAFRMQGD